MSYNIEEKLKELSKDDEAFEQLKKIYNELNDKKERNEHHLDLLESAIRNDYDSILITDLNLEKPGPKIVYVNDGFCKMTGYSKEEVIGKTPRILQGPKTDRAVLDRLKSKLTNGQSFFGQAVNYRKDGSEFVNQWDIHPLTDKEGNITHWVSYQHDITERKRAEKRLVDTNVDFDDLQEESKRTVVDVDLQGNIVMANKAFRELIGYGKDELKQIKAWDLFPKKYRDSLKARFDGEEAREDFEDRQFKGIIKHKNGVPIQIEGRTKIMDLKEHTVVRAEVKNISLQKRIMEALRRKNMDYSKIFNKASEFTYRICVTNGEPEVEYVSEEFPEMTGLSLNTLQEEGLKALVHEDDYDRVVEHFKKAMQGNKCTSEYRIRDKEGNYIEIVDYAKPDWDEKQKEVVCAEGAVSLKTTAQTA